MWKVTVADLDLPFTKEVIVKFAFGKDRLNTILAPEGRNSNKPIFKSLNHRGVARGGGGMLKVGIDRRINREEIGSIID